MELWKGVLFSIELRSQFIVAWKTFLIKKTPRRIDLVRIFQLWLALTWLEAPLFHFKHISIYIKRGLIDVDLVRSTHSQYCTSTSSNIYIYISEAPFHCKYIYLQGGWRWLAPFHCKYIYIYRRGRHFTAQLARASRRRYLPRSRTWEGRGLNNYYNNRKTVWMIHCNRKHTVWINIYYYDATDRR